ncbi:DNA sulfur modification protein DndE [Aliiroseovarius marinus]|uniref:DNA sulfur modification protein DndE n=1 Tax=Aliiroseovarius marinus TaxID=2500159 RepID=UPI0010618A21|nr:DNA sulfur modification protein DndE [Aliiroseovarius marinus]
MTMIDTVRIDDQGREQLIRLKRHTGIETWNVLCRWALCVSLAEPTKPPARQFKGEPAVEIAWRVFGGVHHELYLALIKQRCLQDGLGLDHATVHDQFRLHLHRGLGYLASDRNVRSIGGLAHKLGETTKPAAA